MKQVREIYRKTGRLHHAYGISGERENIKKQLFDFLNNDLKFLQADNPDLWLGEFNVFKINDSRTVNEAHLNRPVKYDKKVFIIIANFITKDAQNSLLKTFEEPQADTTFFLILPSFVGLIPTLRSRLILNNDENTGSEQNSLAEKFLQAKVGERMNMVSKLLKDIKDEKSTKADAIKFVKDLERAVKNKYRLNNTQGGRSKYLLLMEDLEKSISYLNDESPSVKVILEYLAVIVS
jgi:hypothetical protein